MQALFCVLGYKRLADELQNSETQKGAVKVYIICWTEKDRKERWDIFETKKEVEEILQVLSESDDISPEDIFVLPYSPSMPAKDWLKLLSEEV